MAPPHDREGSQAAHGFDVLLDRLGHIGQRARCDERELSRKASDRLQQESRRVAADGPVGRGEAVGHAAQAVTAVDLAGREPGTDERRTGAHHHGDGRGARGIEHATGVGGRLEKGHVAAHRADALHGELG